MAEGPPSNIRRQSEGIPRFQITNNHYYSASAGDLTQVNAGLGNKTFAANKSYGDSSTHLGDGKAFKYIQNMSVTLRTGPAHSYCLYDLRLTMT
jgi:hypothetical protein